MREKLKSRPVLILIITAAVLLSAAVIAVSNTITASRSAVPALSASGEAEAVLTTKIKVYDGIWDTKRYSDEFYRPAGISLTAENYLVVADYMCDRIQIIDGDRNRRIGMPEQYGLSYLDSGALVDGYRENALFMKPAGVFVCENGDIIVCDTGNHVIRRVDAEFVITIAGGGESGYKNGKEFEARFNSPRAAVMGKDGLIYVADSLNHCIRVIDEDGVVSLYAGTPEQSGYKDGALMEAMFFEPGGLCFGEDGALYVADSANHAIRKIFGGAVSTVAGFPGETSVSYGYPGGDYIDGDILSARFNFPRDITVLTDGSIAVADNMNHAVRLITGDEVITLAGSGAAGSYYLSAENIKLTRPEGLCSDGKELYISDSLNNRVIAVPMTERIMAGRPSRGHMLSLTGVSVSSRYSYSGDIRVFIGSGMVDMGRVPPWNTAESIYMPIRPLFEALGADVNIDERAGTLRITAAGRDTFLKLDQDYFILKGVTVTTLTEIERLFPYHLEWFPELSLIAFSIPPDLAEHILRG